MEDSGQLSTFIKNIDKRLLRSLEKEIFKNSHINKNYTEVTFKIQEISPILNLYCNS